MPILEAEDRLKLPVSDNELYDLVLRATGSEEFASKQLQDRVAYRLSRNEKPELEYK